MEQIPFPAKERLLHLMRLLERSVVAGTITSSRIGALTGWASHTVRKDISFLGAVIKNEADSLSSPAGYDPAQLISLIKKALGLEKRRKFCVVGLGRLGSAYLSTRELEGEFELAAGFDTNVNRTEILKSPVPLYPAFKMGEVIGRLGIEIALLCVPAEAAQSAAERLVASGIRGILNFAPAPITVPPEIAVRNIYLLTDELRSLSIKMTT
jgi:redox-sensing transcriptional repressor